MTNLDAWPIKRIARIAGALSIGSGFPDGFSIYVLKKVFVKDDPSATAANILQFETLFRTGIVTEIFALVIFAVSLVFLYMVFKPASRRGSMLFLIVCIMGATIQSLDVFGDITALALLKSTIPHPQVIAYLCLRMHLLVYTVALAFIGFGSLLLAYTATQSTFLPRFGGWFLAIDGAGYITHSFGTLVAPEWIVHIQPFVPYVTAAFGTGALMLWLIFKGVNVERWNEQNAHLISI
jgi:hypothetical protein